MTNLHEIFETEILISSVGIEPLVTVRLSGLCKKSVKFITTARYPQHLHTEHYQFPLIAAGDGAEAREALQKIGRQKAISNYHLNKLSSAIAIAERFTK